MIKKKCYVCGKELPKGSMRYCYGCKEVIVSSMCPHILQKWKDFRLKILARDDGSCKKCGSIEGLHIHHKEPISDGGVMFDMDNCITLCMDCHYKEHYGQNYGINIDKFIDKFTKNP